jgi:excisionase family DNA binding protein
MTGSEAAAYLGISPATFSKWVAAGTIPKPIPNTRRWDRKAIDRALDKASGIVELAVVPETQEVTLADWKAQNEARKAAAGIGGRK